MKNASRHEFSLADKGYGPNILHLVEDKTLCTLGVPAGDVLCLKQAAPLWWKRKPECALKHHCKVPEGSPNTLLVEKLPETPPNKKMQFEKHYPKGGSWMVFGPGTMEGDISPNADFTWYFYSKDLKMMLPLLHGLVLILDGDEEDDHLCLWPSN